MVLNIMRSKKFSKRVLIGLLIIIIPAFVFWGVDAILDPPKPAGKILGRSVPSEDFYSSRQGVQTQIVLNYFSDYASMSSILKDREAMNTMAWERLLLLESARKKGLKVSNQEVMAFIASHPLFMRGGSFDKGVYDSMLRNQALALSPRQFEELVRENLMINKFRLSLLENVSVSDEEIVNRFSRDSDKAVLSYFLMDKDDYFDGIEVSEQEILDAYERNAERMFSEEKAAVEYIESPFSSAEQRSRLASELETLALKISSGTVSMEEEAGRMNLKYGKTGFFTARESLSGMQWFPGFNETTFALKDGEISYPAFPERDKGSVFVIKRVQTILPEPLPLEEVKTEISLALKDSKSLEAAVSKAESLYKAVTENEMSFEDACASAGSVIEKTPPITAAGQLGKIGPARELVIAALDSGSGKFLDPLVTYKGVILARVDDVIKVPLSGLTDPIRETLKEQISEEKKSGAVTEWLRANSASIKPYIPLDEL